MSVKVRRREYDIHSLLHRLGLSFLILVVLLNIGCPKQPGQDEFIAIERILDTGNNERLKKFSSYPIDKQIDIYLFSQINLAGKSDTYFRYLADNGERKVGDIAKRIDSSERASFKTDLIRVLDFIDEGCSCVRNKPNVIRMLSRNDFGTDTSDPADVEMSKELYHRVLLRIRSRN